MYFIFGIGEIFIGIWALPLSLFILWFYLSPWPLPTIMVVEDV
jgi:hypothetical protein